jgi:hypothetical protein
VFLHALVVLEWREDHWLSKRSLLWIEEHADAGDVHPILTAIAQLRQTAQDLIEPAFDLGESQLDGG